MAMAAAARALRGGRRSGACSHHLPLMPGLGRRRALPERASGPLLPRLGAAGDAGGGIGRRLMSEEVPRASPLDRLKEQYVFIPGSGRFVPYDSELVVLDLATRLEKINYQIERQGRYLRYATALVAFVLGRIGGGAAYRYYQNKAIERSLEEIELNLKQAEAYLEEVKVLRRENEEKMP